MHRFFVDTPIGGVGERVCLNAEESAHAARVLRLRPGEEVRLLDGENIWAAELETVDVKETAAVVTAACASPEAPAKAVLFQGDPGPQLGGWGCVL